MTKEGIDPQSALLHKKRQNMRQIFIALLRKDNQTV
jgi:hypothetical protein